MRLTTRVHDRDVAGMTYVYPVVSRRAGGVSVGVNLNPNNACNFRCVYCQVPGLTFGKGRSIELELLREELTRMLAALVNGDYMERHVPEGSRRLNDVAFSGNGEPTSSPDFAAAVESTRQVVESFGLTDSLKLVLITNGSLVHQEDVQTGLRTLADPLGEVWFKLDSGSEEGRLAINDSKLTNERVRANLVTACGLAPAWVQTCAFARNGEPPDQKHQREYCAFLRGAIEAGADLRGVLLYGLARQSHQPEAPELSPLSESWMQAWAERIAELGVEVRLTP